LAQATQAAPPAPHAPGRLPGWQTLLAQQPAHEVPLQTHWPLTQARPGLQGALLPHWQAPLAQVSATLGSHGEQAPPPAPQVTTDGESQVVPAQQPLGHDCALQTHLPLTQRCPATQAWPPPQVQAPLAQASASDGSQVEQPFPATPQAPSDGRLHVAPLQHPVGHETPSHTHWPPKQRCPIAQGAPLPHLQAPVTQESASSGSQAMQAAPPMPQVITDGGLQELPVQHPFMQVCAHPVQAPLMHC
jgi:hypothetical protein